MSLLAGILAACITLVMLFEPIHAVYIPGPNDAHAYKSAVAHFSLSNSLEVSLFMPVKKEDCAFESERLYMPAGVARASDEQFLGNVSTSVFDKMSTLR